MKNFLKMIFASTIGVILGAIILSIISIFIFVGIVASFSSTPTYSLGDNSIVKIDLEGTINERKSDNPFAFLMGSKNSGNGLNDILDAIKKAKENDQVKGIYIKAGGANAGFATQESIRKALIDFKTGGKFIVTYADQYAQGDYYICSVADKVLMNPQGAVEYIGLSFQPQFYKGMFEKMGIKLQVFKVGTYKSAIEPLILDKMSDANREQVSSYLGDIWGHIQKSISESRNIPVEKLNEFADKGLLFKPEAAIEYRLVDELMYSDQVEKFLKSQVGIEEDKELSLASVSDLKTVPFAKKKKSENKIAVLYAEGSIVPDNFEDHPMTSSSVITAKKFVKELNKLKEDDNIKAVVFRVNSGGGSAYASEQILHAVKELKAVKPIIVSMGDLAASGGYYISCAATKIVAEPTTITGSIGIFGVFPSAEELSKRTGASFDVFKTNEYADFGGRALSEPLFGLSILPARPLNNGEMALLQNYIETGYDTFLDRCATGRSKTKAEIDSIGQGRVWTGNQALARGLVDKTGNLDDAIKLAAETAAIDEYDLQSYPEQKDFFSQLLEESMGGMQTYFLKQFLGADKYESKILLNNLKNHDVRQAILLDY